MNLKSKVIVITGGTKGLGKAMAEIFIEKGAKVVSCGRDEADVTRESQLESLMEKTVSKFGHVDMWINNAGVWMPPQKLEDMDLKKAKNLFETNVFGTIHGMRVALRQMKKQGNGTIVNIISTTAFDGMNGSSGSMYVASKYALRGLTNSSRDEMKGSDIQIIGVYPGGFKSDLFNDAKPDNIDQFMSVDSVAEKIVKNLESSSPETQLIIKRPGQIASNELT